jgi:membrane complex biogenesis BtpA family protein
MAVPLLQALLGEARPVIGVVHLPPLPGSPRWGGRMDRLLERATSDARALAAAGVDALVVENYGDAPFVSGRVDAATAAALAVAARACIDASGGLPAGINCLRNDPDTALAIAVATGARFIRVNCHTGAVVSDQGLLQGRAGETFRERARLRADGVEVFADVLVKHAQPLGPRDPRTAAREAWLRGGAGVLLVTGPATGSAPDLRELAAVRDELPGAPLLAASGVTARNVRLVAALCDGVLVGSALERGGRAGNPVDPARARAFVKAARRALGRKG